MSFRYFANEDIQDVGESELGVIPSDQLDNILMYLVCSSLLYEYSFENRSTKASLSSLGSKCFKLKLRESSCCNFVSVSLKMCKVKSFVK